MVIIQYNLYILGSIFEPCYIQNRFITNRVIKRLWCNMFFLLSSSIHVFFFIGEVKEKAKARKEYKEAVAKGHGAYLMEEETPVSIWRVYDIYLMSRFCRYNVMRCPVG